MPKPATNAKAISNTDKPRGRKAVALREAQNLPLNQSLSVPHLPMTEERKATFLQNLAACGQINQAASLTDGGLHTSRSYRRLQSQDPAFARLMDDAIQGYAARVHEQVNRAAGLSEDSEMIPLVSAGEIICDPVTKQPIYVRKYSEKILLSLSRSTRPEMRDHRVVTNQAGQPIDDPSNPTIVISVADLQRLDLTDSEMLIAICRKIYSNRVEEFSGPDMKVINKNFDGEFEDVTPADKDPWEDEPDLVPSVLGRAP